jgi:hypothetical protein
MVPADPDQRDVAEGGGGTTLLELSGGAFVALATLLGALVDLQSFWDSESVALQRSLLLLIPVAGVAAVIGLLRKRRKLTGRNFTRALVFVVFGVVLAGGVMVINLWKSGHRSEPITISNVVTEGGGVRDTGDGFLSTEPRNYCRTSGCVVDGSVLRTGDVVQAQCQLPEGPWVYNADLASETEVRNPAFAKSRRWYGATDADGREGYLAEVWVDPAGRGGLGLPRCRRD